MQFTWNMYAHTDMCMCMKYCSLLRAKCKRVAYSEYTQSEGHIMNIIHFKLQKNENLGKKFFRKNKWHLKIDEWFFRKVNFILILNENLKILFPNKLWSFSESTSLIAMALICFIWLISNMRATIRNTHTIFFADYCLAHFMHTEIRFFIRLTLVCSIFNSYIPLDTQKNMRTRHHSLSHFFNLRSLGV